MLSWELYGIFAVLMTSTFKKAEKLGLEGKDIVLTTEGVGGVETIITTKLFNVSVCIKKRKPMQVYPVPVLW